LLVALGLELKLNPVQWEYSKRPWIWDRTWKSSEYASPSILVLWKTWHSLWSICLFNNTTNNSNHFLIPSAKSPRNVSLNFLLHKNNIIHYSCTTPASTKDSLKWYDLRHTLNWSICIANVNLSSATTFLQNCKRINVPCASEIKKRTTRTWWIIW